MAKKTYVEVLNQIEALRKEADRLKREEADGVIQRIREAVAAYGLTADDIFGASKRGRSKASGAKSASAKRAATKGSKSASSSPYSDGKGNVWGGRGPRPLWLREALAAGATLESFATDKRESASSEQDKPVAAKKGRRSAGTKRASAKRAVAKRPAKAKRASSKQQAAAAPEAASQDSPTDA